MRSHWKVCGMTAALLLVAGCATGRDEARAPRGTERPAGGGFSVRDARIAMSVKARLTAERAGNLVSVDVRSRDGVVYLDGHVPTREDRAAAERIAWSVDGVRDVVNGLEVRTARGT
jgi:hyperosmotically inducible protein